MDTIEQGHRTATLMSINYFLYLSHQCQSSDMAITKTKEKLMNAVFIFCDCSKKDRRKKIQGSHRRYNMWTS